ncbi:MAG: hypothetical protein A2508_09495 [Candidatus Lambdaproteobacteria bacterium RIFOXYD12_FULL_49_8]|uniref:6-carboxy-5,6,7,8-tetrahydropterin synthase n=1 Tax=Candidatus Lambdaproteobacteria bacterium RIFOXYD2_FULL_50_16 TaxID=1817772 RepID=A0A1F6GAA3_9PROT|nr:MAG: hypothetical protein A2527_12485 [Candidatus Lambdaproteobacteria bacterium RIFOXYD2_FULL_50_16]OGG97361.1 MAG: hypothetical protein A2508_09495 [Candidatus Lambdaproteobacteria bacterium RIFOXYD12_FULL_49_8]
MIIRKLFKAEVAHRVAMAYTARCQGVHGHSYKFEVFLTGETQDQAQMLMDFKLLKDKFNNFMDSFDHSLLVWEQDPALVEMAPKLNNRFMILPYNPTAEQMSRHIFQEAEAMGLPIKKVICHETETGYAEFDGSDPIRIDLTKVVFSKQILAEYK